MIANQFYKPEFRASVAALIQESSGCTSEQAAARAAVVTDLSAPLDYSPWRHGGWYVGAVRYVTGACGCVSRNYPDRKWRIACDPRGFDAAPTFKSRDEAARAEQLLALEGYTAEAIAAELESCRETTAAIAAQRAEVAHV